MSANQSKQYKTWLVKSRLCYDPLLLEHLSPDELWCCCATEMRRSCVRWTPAWCHKNTLSRQLIQSNWAHLFSPLYHSNVGEGTAATSHLSRAVRPRPTQWLFISWMAGATGGNKEIRNVGGNTHKKHLCSHQHNNNVKEKVAIRHGALVKEGCWTWKWQPLTSWSVHTLHRVNSTLYRVHRGGVGEERGQPSSMLEKEMNCTAWW